jgi:hypothetical protein
MNGTKIGRSFRIESRYSCAFLFMIGTWSISSLGAVSNGTTEFSFNLVMRPPSPIPGVRFTAIGGVFSIGYAYSQHDPNIWRFGSMRR